MKKVTVIIPVYKVEKYIGAAVASVLAQTYQNWELLIVDDGSPDASVTICQQFDDARIKIIRQPNGGVSAARNTGIRHAQGEYIAFLDGDDLWLPQKLEKHLAHLESSPSVGVSFSRSAFIDESGDLLGTFMMPKLKDITPSYLLIDSVVGNGSAAVIRREVIKDSAMQNCYFDEQLHHAEDLEYWLRIAIQTSWQIEGISEALTLYRVNPQGASKNLLKQLESFEKVLAKTRTYAPELIAQCERPAKAYQLKSLARSAIRLQAGFVAVKLMHQALATHWSILKEPRRTLMTVVAAYLLWFLPESFYRQIETIALKVIGAVQKYRILQARQSG
ncbi:glycosyltransferase family 2 protein [Gloeocapsopsis crepidinum LEGE 06123]|uniref:Glycosyltransferase family 2 protein n=1 Tax=Gloeocapsopsis crepidinum LEGE 06123 TaxID=588587 RepID=A0ABR9UXH7_9CHRO|nr:glycosyltransferase family 2 protein [Gloeocapsopsis crepidinum]MBE9192695.1 glycosyltransferase family 2 protein [Gloeocapsopsis crepidinum LEGE 06123]